MNFAPHVAAYVFSYVIMAKATVQAVCQLCYTSGPVDKQQISFELGTYRMVCLGFPLLTIGLILGRWWGKIGLGGLLGMGPKRNVVIGLVAGICNLLSLSLHVWQKISPH